MVTKSSPESYYLHSLNVCEGAGGQVSSFQEAQNLNI